MSDSSLPVIFLDMDDVVVRGRPVWFDKHQVDTLSPELCKQLIHPPAGQALSELLDEHATRVVATSNWVRFTSRHAFERLFSMAGYPQVARALHPAWCAPTPHGATRLQVIDAWLEEHHRGEPYCVLDDADSGASLLGSSHDRAQRVLLCPVETGLHRGHVPFIQAALKRHAARGRDGHG